MKFILYTDGACSGNPGPGGFGSIVIADLKYVTELGAAYQQTTNNRMELQAVISGLKFILLQKNKSFEVQVYTDSVYVIRGITQWVFGWKRNGWKNSTGAAVVNQDLWEELLSLVQQIPTQVKWAYVRGHNNDPGNERCDEIAVAYSKQSSIYLYEGNAAEYLFDVTVPPRTEEMTDHANRQKPTGEKKSSWYLSLINGVVTKYATWSECEAQVKGRPGVKFKKVSSASEETDLLKSWGK
jgi:ribonuclease HI